MMNTPLWCIVLFVLAPGNVQAQLTKNTRVGNSSYSVTWAASNISQLTYVLNNQSATYPVTLPAFRIDGKNQSPVLKALKIIQTPAVLKNGVIEYVLEGEYKSLPGLHLQVIFQVSPDNPVCRFQYRLKSDREYKLTKVNGKDAITYLNFTASGKKVKEVRLSEFNERFHATHLTEATIDDRYFQNQSSLMGPILVTADSKASFLVAYEHGSQYPDRFIEFGLGAEGKISVQSVKGNYLEGEKADGFSSIWFEMAAVVGSEDQLAEKYRAFVLKYLTQNEESRKPYLFYNTWGRQERVQWTGQKYLTSMNLDQTLKEIDRAHAMGIEVFVIDAGWFKKTGDWEVNKSFFADELSQVKAKLDMYQMKLGLWFNPTVAAVTSEMYKRNLKNRMSSAGKFGEPREIWETEESVGLCLVSSYWEDFAQKLISLSKSLGVTYFKWDAIGQYGCNDAGHFHGTAGNTTEERTQRYAFLQPLYMSRIVDKLCKEVPGAIVDFDITEDGRCVGLQFLSAGKYFIINNGPYYHNYDLAPEWKSVLPNGNPNIFVQPGPARGWFVRSVLDYDKWIPSVLFLTHYQPDEPANSQIINIASLMLGQNGIWGEILKTSQDGVELFNSILSKYKTIRDDITVASMVHTGEPGGSPEVYEKINPKTGKGCVVIFANSKGTYQYITMNKAVNKIWHNDGASVRADAKGRAIITATFEGPSARIIMFGAE